MSITDPYSPRPPLEPPVRPLTAADLAELPPELPSGPVRYELDNGRLVTMTPPGFEHGSVEARITAALLRQGEEAGHGVVCCGETGLVLWRNPDRVVGMDVAFITADALPPKLSPEGYLETIPQLVVEIASKNDTPSYLQAKTADYLQAGVGVVWIVEPAKESVTEHRSGTPPQTSLADDQLTLEDVIPGLRLAVGQLFSQ